MRKFLKDEFNGKGALREDKRHFPFAVTRAPVGLVRLCFWVEVAAAMLPGRWGGAEGSALPAEGALLSSMALSWGDCSREGCRTAPGAVKAVSSSCLWSVMLAYCSRTSKGSAEAWACAGLQSSKAPGATAGGLTEQTFLGSVLRGRLRGTETGRTFWGSISAFCVLLEVGWWEDAGLHHPFPLPARDIAVCSSVGKATPRGHKGLMKGKTRFTFVLSKSTTKLPPTDFSSSTCFLVSLMRYNNLMVVYLIC